MATTAWRRSRMYDHPFQWGSKRTGPDLARVGGRYSDEWHRQHLIDPRSVVPESVMPGYAFLLDKEIDGKGIGKHLAALNLAVNNGRGAMYTEEQIANAEADFVAQATGNDADAMLERYPKAQARDFDGQPARSPRWMRSSPTADARHAGRHLDLQSRQLSR